MLLVVVCDDDDPVCEGRGVYFSERAAYVQGRYAHSTHGPRGEPLEQILLANVLLGHVKNYGTEKAPTLTRPPERVRNRLYDSVQGGPHKGWFRSAGTAAVMRVVYSNAQCLPAYVISYVKV